MNSALQQTTDAEIFAAMGKTLAQLRQNRSLSDAQVAAATGIDRGELILMEGGKSAIHAGHIVRLSECYQVSPAVLFLGLAHHFSASVNEEDMHHLLSRFLQVDQPSRGDLFKGLIAEIAAQSKHSKPE